MAISVKGESGDPMVEPNVIPLVDIMLVLLIIFIITIPVMTHAVKIDLPRDNPNPPPVEPVVVRIFVEFDGTIYWNGDIIGNKAALEEKMVLAAAQPVQPEVHLRPNKLAEYKDVASVMASAQRLGLVKLGLVGNEQFVQ